MGANGTISECQSNANFMPKCQIYARFMPEGQESLKPAIFRPERAELAQWAQMGLFHSAKVMPISCQNARIMPEIMPEGQEILKLAICRPERAELTK